MDKNDKDYTIETEFINMIDKFRDENNTYNKSYWNTIKGWDISTFIVLLIFPFISYFEGQHISSQPVSGFMGIFNYKPLKMGCVLLMFYVVALCLIDIIYYFRHYIHENNYMRLREYVVRKAFFKYYFQLIVMYNIAFLSIIKFWSSTSYNNLIICNIYLGFILLVVWISQVFSENMLEHSLNLIIMKDACIHYLKKEKDSKEIDSIVYRILINKLRELPLE